MPIDEKLLLTEQRNKDTEHIDKMDTLSIIKCINKEDKTVAYAVEKELTAIAAAAEVIYEAIKDGGRLLYIGAGTSGRLGILDASECPPTYGIDASMVQGIIAGGKEAVFVAKEGAEDSEELAIIDLKNINLSDKDIVCGLAASGRTPYVLGGLKYANKIGAKTVSVCCVKGGEVSTYAKYPIAVLVGPEVVTGSTRMKAGTAQKMVLNMLSTAVMIKLGKVYSNLMVDVKPTNEKLVNRAIGIIMQCTNLTYDKSREMLQKANNEVKVAILMSLTGSDIDTCKQMLHQNNENVASAIMLYKE